MTDTQSQAASRWHSPRRPRIEAAWWYLRHGYVKSAALFTWWWVRGV